VSVIDNVCNVYCTPRESRSNNGRGKRERLRASRAPRGKVPWAKAGVNVYSYLCLSHGETEGVKDSVAVGSTAAVITKFQSTIVVFLPILTLLTC
jgi:hypothetical protein